MAHGTQVFNNFKKFKVLCNSVYIQGSWNLQFMAMVMQLILENNQVNIISPGDWNNDINFKIIHGKFHCFDVHFLEIFVQVIEIFLDLFSLNLQNTRAPRGQFFFDRCLILKKNLICIYPKFCPFNKICTFLSQFFNLGYKMIWLESLFLVITQWKKNKYLYTFWQQFWSVLT